MKLIGNCFFDATRFISKGWSNRLDIKSRQKECSVESLRSQVRVGESERGCVGLNWHPGRWTNRICRLDNVVGARGDCDTKLNSVSQALDRSKGGGPTLARDSNQIESLRADGGIIQGGGCVIGVVCDARPRATV